MAADYVHEYNGMTREAMLAKMAKGWMSSETPCGRGSEKAMTTGVRQLIPLLIKEHGFTTIADAGAGDLNWMRFVDIPEDVTYQGYDLHPRHPDVIEFDITSQVLVPCDLIICRHVLNHLSVKLANDAITNFMASRARYLLMTFCDNQSAYWTKHGLQLWDPVNAWKDATKWTIGLWDLTEGDIRRVNPELR